VIGCRWAQRLVKYDIKPCNKKHVWFDGTLPSTSLSIKAITLNEPSANERSMHIWVDADACPLVIKEILYRVANRTQTQLTLIANQMLRVPPSPWIKALQVPSGFDVADQRIADEAHAGDIVVTADIPLAALVVAKQAWVLDPRGDLIDHTTIQARLTMRNFMDELRGSGVDTGGPSAFSAKDARTFANQLDRLLARQRRLAAVHRTFS
jgi:uncharacterized protein YaiI (UPF0178 family)